MEGHSECVRYLVQQLLDARRRQLVPCPTTQHAGAKLVLGVTNNVGETAVMLAERFLKYDTVDTIDHLLAPSTTSPDDDGIYARFIACL